MVCERPPTRYHAKFRKKKTIITPPYELSYFQKKGGAVIFFFAAESPKKFILDVRGHQRGTMPILVQFDP